MKPWGTGTLPTGLVVFTVVDVAVVLVLLAAIGFRDALLPALRRAWGRARERDPLAIVGPPATTSTNTDPTVRGALEQCEPWSHLVDFEGKIGEVSMTPKAARSGKIPHSRYCPGCRARVALTTVGLLLVLLLAGCGQDAGPKQTATAGAAPTANTPADPATGLVSVRGTSFGNQSFEVVRIRGCLYAVTTCREVMGLSSVTTAVSMVHCADCDNPLHRASAEEAK